MMAQRKCVIHQEVAFKSLCGPPRLGFVNSLVAAVPMQTDVATIRESNEGETRCTSCGCNLRENIKSLKVGLLACTPVQKSVNQAGATSS